MSEITLLPCPICNSKHVDCDGDDMIMCEKCGFECRTIDWKNIPRALTWTTEPPEVPGWYWWRWDRYSESYPLEVRDGLIVEHPRKTLRNSSDISGEWAGPIPMPMVRGEL